MSDRIDDYLAQWRRERPDLDPSPMAIIGRLSRAHEIAGRAVTDNFRGHGLHRGEFDTLATLRRSGEPYTLTPGELARSSMVTGAAMTNRLQRLEERGLLERTTDTANRRSVLVRLTDDGLALVDEAVVTHLRVEQDLLDSALNAKEQAQLARLLSRFLERSGDTSDALAPRD